MTDKPGKPNNYRIPNTRIKLTTREEGTSKTAEVFFTYYGTSWQTELSGQDVRKLRAWCDKVLEWGIKDKAMRRPGDGLGF